MDDPQRLHWFGHVERMTAYRVPDNGDYALHASV